MLNNSSKIGLAFQSLNVKMSIQDSHLSKWCT